VTSFAGECFELLECIGRGATGGVYRARTSGASARASGFARDVCIKRLSGQFSADGERALREEARLLSSVRHSNVVSLLAMGHEPSGSPFLVLELVEGADLGTLTRAIAAKGPPGQLGGLPDLVAVYVACALLRALGAVQRAIPGLVHRDVTPHNVLLSREGEVKLTDFGIALALDRARWTRPAIVKGKFGYMAPEQVRGNPIDVRSDLFVVGILLFELLGRRRPWFAPRGTMDELRAIERGEIGSILECRPRLDRALADAVDRLLALDRRDRFPTCDAALRALAPFSAGELGSLRLASILEATLPAPRPARVALGRDGGEDTQSAPMSDLPLTGANGDHVASEPAFLDDAEPTVIEGGF
jgi:serine/threonine-protein kinase